MRDISRRLGFFYVSNTLHNKMLYGEIGYKKFFSNFFIISIKYDFNSEIRRKYLAASVLFDELPEGLEIPIYDVVFENEEILIRKIN